MDYNAAKLLEYPKYLAIVRSPCRSAHYVLLSLDSRPIHLVWFSRQCEGGSQ